MDDLDKLIAAAEAGEVGWNRLATIAEDAVPPREAALAATAYSGSLDAALRLHEALLPGWSWNVEDHGDAIVYRGDAMRNQEAFEGDSDTPARAWLLAILRAVKAQPARSAGEGE